MLSLSFRFILYITANTSNHLGIQSAVLLTPLPPEGSPKTSLSGCPHTNSVLFLYLSLSPSQLSRLFFVFFPSFVDTHTRAQTDRQTQLYDIYDIPVNVKVQVLDSICASHSILFIYCVPVYCHLFYVYSLSLYLSLFLVYSKKRSWITPAVQIFQ